MLVGKRYSKCQVIIDIFDKKLYKGGFESEKIASEFYDKMQINIFGLYVRILTTGKS